MRIKTDGNLVEVYEVSVFNYKPCYDEQFSSDDTEEVCGFRAITPKYLLTWYADLKQTSLDEARERVDEYVDHLLKEGWLDMSKEPGEFVYESYEDTYEWD